MLVFPSLGPGASMPKDEVEESTIGKPSLAVPQCQRWQVAFFHITLNRREPWHFLKKALSRRHPHTETNFAEVHVPDCSQKKRVAVIWDFNAIFARTEIRAEDRDRSCWAKRLSDPGSPTQDVPVRPWNSMTSSWLYQDARLLSSIHDLTRKQENPMSFQVPDMPALKWNIYSCLTDTINQCSLMSRSRCRRCNTSSKREMPVDRPG